MKWKRNSRAEGYEKWNEKYAQFSCSIVSNSLLPHELQHARPPCPSPNPRVHPNPCPLSQWCHPTISSSVVPFSSCPQSPLSIRVFSNESALHIRWPKYWSFSLNISPSNEHPGLISLRMDLLDLLTVQGTLKSLLQQILCANKKNKELKYCGSNSNLVLPMCKCLTVEWNGRHTDFY